MEATKGYLHSWVEQLAAYMERDADAIEAGHAECANPAVARAARRWAAELRERAKGGER